MPNNSGIDLPRPSFIRNPLTIVGLFVALTEFAIAYGLGKVTGEAQAALVFFIIAFPTLYGIAFFLILFFRPRNLYAPTDYRQEENFLAAFEQSGVRVVAAELAKQATQPINVPITKPGETDPSKTFIANVNAPAILFYLLKSANKTLTIDEQEELLNLELENTFEFIARRRRGRDGHNDSQGPNTFTTGVLWTILSLSAGFAVRPLKASDDKFGFEISQATLAAIASRLAELQAVRATPSAPPVAKRES